MPGCGRLSARGPWAMKATVVDIAARPARPQKRILIGRISYYGGYGKQAGNLGTYAAFQYGIRPQVMVGYGFPLVAATRSGGRGADFPDPIAHVIRNKKGAIASDRYTNRTPPGA